MNEKDAMDTRARGESETTEPPGAAGETTEAVRDSETTPAVRDREMTAKRLTAMLNAKCPHCGVTNGGHPDMIKRYKTAGRVLYVKCHACLTNFKIAVKE